MNKYGEGIAPVAPSWLWFWSTIQLSLNNEQQSIITIVIWRHLRSNVILRIFLLF